MHALHITCNRSTQILINQESGKDSNCKMIECYVSGLVFEIYAMFLEVSPLATKSCPNFDWGGIEPCVTPKYKITKLLIGVGFITALPVEKLVFFSIHASWKSVIGQQGAEVVGRKLENALLAHTLPRIYIYGAATHGLNAALTLWGTHDERSAIGHRMINTCILMPHASLFDT